MPTETNGAGAREAEVPTDIGMNADREKMETGTGVAAETAAVEVAVETGTDAAAAEVAVKTVIDLTDIVIIGIANTTARAGALNRLLAPLCQLRLRLRLVQSRPQS